MKPLKKLTLIPILAMFGTTAAQITVPAAYGDDSVRVSASVLFNLNNGTSGYVSIGEPMYERVIERVVEPPVVYVYREPRPVIIHEHVRPVVVVHETPRYYVHPGKGHAYGHEKRGRDVVIIEQNARGYDRCDRGGERYIRSDNRCDRGGERYIRSDNRYDRGGERYIRNDDRYVQGGERYIQNTNGRYTQGNGRVVRYEVRNDRGDNGNGRGHARQVIENRKGKHGK